MRIKTVLIFILVYLFITSITTIAFADVRVRGYYRKDGTYVSGHWRSNPDGNPYNNWSFPGNVNPHTGKVATGNPYTYLKNYYRSSSPYKYHSDLKDTNFYHNNQPIELTHQNQAQYWKELEKLKQSQAQYYREQERLKQKRQKDILGFLAGFIIGYIIVSSQSSQ